MMRFYNQQHAFYCGVDLHAKTMHVCVVNQFGETLVHRNLPSRPDYFLNAIGLDRKELVVGVECMFAWYWLADLCCRENIPFVLGKARLGKGLLTHSARTAVELDRSPLQ